MAPNGNIFGTAGAKDLINLIRTHTLPFTLLMALVATGIAGLLPSFPLFLVGQLALVIIVTVACTVLMGGAGLLALSSAAFMAIGGYGVLILIGKVGVPLLVAVPMTVVAGAAVGAVLGFITLRISGFYLAIATLGFLQVLLVAIKQGGALTGGGYGLVVPMLDSRFLPELTSGRLALVSLFTMIVVVGLAVNLMRSRVGRALIALRDNEAAAQMQGINVSLMKISAFAFSSSLICLAGVLHAFLLGAIHPGGYTMNLSVFHITLVVVGGMTGSIIGAVLAPLVLYLLPEVFSTLGEWRDVFYGTILLVTLVFMPLGISSKLQPLLKRVIADKPA